MLSDTQNIYHYFHESAHNWPDHCALHVRGREYTYRQLEQFTDRIVPHLKNTEGDFIGLFTRKSISSYAGVLAILKAGKGYVPFSPKYPTSRNEGIRETADISLLIADSHCPAELNRFLSGCDQPLTVLFPDTDASFATQIESGNRHRLIFKEEILAGEDSVEEIETPAKYAYLLFTSGSTGKPKGVPVSHHNVRHYVDYINSVYDFNEKDRMSQTFDLTFDPSVHDLFVGWSNGSALYSLTDQEGFLPAKFIQRHQLTVWYSVPSIPRLMQVYKTLKEDQFPLLRYSLFSGEALHEAVASLWHKAAPNSLIDNLYGPTENTINITMKRWDPAREPKILSFNGIMSIGKVFPGHRYRLLPTEESLNGAGEHAMTANGEENGRPGLLATPKAGELLISGEQVVDSYFRNEEATSKGFRTFDDDPDTRWYCTGDLVRDDGKGGLFYVGRKDSQIKIRGNRVELGEIKYTIERLTGPQTSVLLPWPYKSDYTKSIMLFLLESVEQSDQEILQFSKKKLPEYMVPQAIQRIPEFPLNNNGKIDKRKLVNQYENGKRDEHKRRAGTGNQKKRERQNF